MLVCMVRVLWPGAAVVRAAFQGGAHRRDSSADGARRARNFQQRAHKRERGALHSRLFLLGKGGKAKSKLRVG